MTQQPGFRDHFSGHAAQYARYRPTYPDALFDWLAAVAPATGRAWDCATGNGQAARGLARHFREVIATDASARQIASAKPADRVSYGVATAEDSRLATGSVDLVTVAQAAHWFDLSQFYAEVARVARPGAVIALWTYAMLKLPGPAGELLSDFEHSLVGPYWPPERALVDAGYATLTFPFEVMAAPAFEMRVHWTLRDLMGYLATWSATRRYIGATGTDPVPALERAIEPHWPDSRPRAIRWPLILRAGRVQARQLTVRGASEKT